MIVKCLHKNKKRDENLRALTIDALYLVVTIAYENNKIWYGLLNNNSVLFPGADTVIVTA